MSAASRAVDTATSEVLGPAGARAGGASLRRGQLGWSAFDLASIAVPTVVAAIVSLVAISARSIWLDEAATISIAHQSGGALLRAMAHDGGNMLGYYALIHVLIEWFGDGLIVVRLPAALAMIASVAMLSSLARQLFDRLVGLLSGLVAALSLPLVFWAQDARSYALVVACVVASYLAFWHILAAPRDEPRRAWWAALTASTIVGIYMSYVVVLVAPAQLLFVAGNWRRLRGLLAVYFVSGLCASPLVVLAIHRGTGQLAWLERPGWRALVAVVEAVTSGGFVPNFHLGVLGAVITLSSVVVLGLIAAENLIARRSGRQDGAPFALLWSWTLVPVLAAFVESRLGPALFIARNVLMVLPAVAILLCAGLLRTRLPRWLGWGALLALTGLRTAQLVPTYGVSPENWRVATAYVASRARPGDCIAFYPSDGRMAFDYYLLHDQGATAATELRPVLPSAPWGLVRPYVEQYVTLSNAQLARDAKSCSRLWFVASHEGQANGTASSRAHHTRYLELRRRLSASFGPGHLVAFGWAAPVKVELFARANLAVVP